MVGNKTNDFCEWFQSSFANISNKINSKFQNLDDFYLERPKSIVFVSKGCLIKILKHVWDLYLINPIMIYWVWTSFYRKEPAPYISISLANVINKSLESGVFGEDLKNARVMPIYMDDGDINDENDYRSISVIGHIAKIIESLVNYQIIDWFFWKNTVLFQWTNMIIWKDTQHKLASNVL